MKKIVRTRSGRTFEGEDLDHTNEPTKYEIKHTSYKIETKYTNPLRERYR